MMKLIIDGCKVGSKAQLHELIADELKFPEWYGGNLDALFDCLTDVREETEIELVNEEILREKLGSYADALKKVLERACEENSRLTIADAVTG